MGATRLAIVAVIGMATTEAAADGLDGERFAPAVSAEGSFVAEHPAVPYHLGWGLGLFLHFADDAVVERNADDEIVGRPLDSALTADLVASLGLFGRVELGLHLPIHLIYEGDAYATGGTVLSAGAGLGDLRVVPKVALLRTGDVDRHLLLGLALPFTAPTGNEEELRGAGGVTLEPRILFAVHLARLGLGFDVGYRWRAEHPPTLPWGDSITLGPWLSYGLTDALIGRVEVLAEKHVVTEEEGADFPIELIGGVEYRIGGLGLYGGASVGLTDGIGDPDFRVIGGVRFRSGVGGRQGFADSDGDGVMDKDDAAPDEPEDDDDFHDEDGAPEADNDGDGILDEDDECPDLAGERDRQGCPSRTFVKVEEGKLYIIGKVQFRSGSGEVSSNSEPLLDQVAQALDANPQVKRVRIEGHTDDVGDDALNQRLSEQRAASVKAGLVKRGVDEGRLETRGYGETQPMAPNRSAAGRHKNRRVEFIIVESGQ